jgi:hypothetical protein
MTNQKTQTRGYCQCCGRQQAVKGTMAHHGYTVENGWFQGACAGHSFAPIEQERARADEICAQVRKQAAELSAKADRYEAGEVTPEQIKSGRSQTINGKREPIMVAWSDAPEYLRKQAVELIVWNMRQHAKRGEQFADDLQRIADARHGQPLLVVAVEAKVARIEAGERRMSGKGVVLVAKYQDGGRVYYQRNGALGWMGSRAWRALAIAE